jgi:hypothetical protein
MSERPATVTTSRPGRPPRGRPTQHRPAGRTQAKAGSGGIRPAVERRSAAQLVFLRQLPAWIPALIMAALLVAGLAVRGWTGAAALVVVALFAGWLGYLSWPALGWAGRAGRAAAVACMLGLAVLQAMR